MNYPFENDTSAVIKKLARNYICLFDYLFISS